MIHRRHFRVRDGYAKADRITIRFIEPWEENEPTMDDTERLIVAEVIKHNSVLCEVETFFDYDEREYVIALTNGEQSMDTLSGASSTKAIEEAIISLVKSYFKAPPLVDGQLMAKPSRELGGSGRW